MFHDHLTRMLLASAVLWTVLLPVQILYAQENVSENNNFQQEQEAFVQAFLEDVDVTMSELINFSAYVADALKPLLNAGEEESRNFELHSENYVELAKQVFEKYYQPLFQTVRQTAVDFFTPEQYTKLTTRCYQLSEFVEIVSETDNRTTFDNANLFLKASFQVVLLSEIMELSDEQKADLTVLQQEMVTEFFGIEAAENEMREFEKQEQALREEFTRAETAEQKEVLQKKIADIQVKIAKTKERLAKKLFPQLKEKLDKLLTAEQKATLIKLHEELPEYMKKVLAKQSGGLAEKESKSTWQPGINSWKPGDGAPQDLDQYRETKRERKPQQRRVPGSLEENK